MESDPSVAVSVAIREAEEEVGGGSGRTHLAIIERARALVTCPGVDA